MNDKRQGFWIAMVGVVTICATLFSSAVAEHRYRNKTKVAEEEFTLRDGGALDIDVEDMDIQVKKTASSKSRVTVFVGGDDGERAVEYFQEHMTFEAAMDGNTLRIESTDPSHGSWRFWQKYQNVSVWAVVEVPTRLDAHIRTEDGDLDIDELEGEIDLRTTDGDINAPMLSGLSIRIKSVDGDIQTRALTAERNIDIDTTDGGVFARTIKADQLTLSTTDGDVEIEHIIAEDIDLSAGDGDVEIGCEGGKLTAHCSDGDMIVRLFSGMEVDLTTGDGDIDLRVPRAMGAELELYGEDVHVSRGINVKGRVSTRRVIGSMNDGGKTIKVRTNDGTISVRSNSK